jgi:4-hydroxybenzoate polyprenyltransferase
MAAPAAAVPTTREIVCVDLDGTLIAGDLLWESLLRLILLRPLLLLRLPLWVVRGRAYLKRQVALRIAIDATALPYRDEVLSYLQASSARGDTLVLATASDELYARAVHQHLRIFDEVVASDGVVNMSGRRKASVLRDRFGAGGFHYVGNDWADVHVWSESGGATVVGAPARLIRGLEGKVAVRQVLAPAKTKFSSILRALRPHQWAKNILVFAPLVAAHQVFTAGPLLQAVLAFAAFSLCASAVYVVNDLLDVEADRLHPRKRLRPFAAGELSIPFGLVLSASLLVAGLSLAAVASPSALVGILALYLVVTTAYSMGLKREPVVDVFVLAGLYVMRLVAGGIASGITLSSWFLAFALFLFLSLAFVKRYTELITNGRAPGRGYGSDDAQWMQAVGTSSGYMAVVVMALYVSAPDVSGLYQRPKALWMLCPVLLFWITRTWFRAGRRQMHDDPVVEALKDPVGYVCAAIVMLTLILAL